MSKVETSQTLSRGLNVLTLIAASQDGLTPSEIAEKLHISRTIVYRLLNTLLEHRLVRRSDSGDFFIAPATLSLSTNVLGSIYSSTRTTLAELARETNATAHFSVLDGSEVLALAVEEPPHSAYHLSYRIGARTSLEQGALGEAIRAAKAGELKLFESEGQLIPGAHGMVVSIPNITELPAAIGLVTPAGKETDSMRKKLFAAAKKLAGSL